MRRYLAVLLAIGVLAGMMGAPADAKKRKKAKVREVLVTYGQPAIGVGGVGGGCSGCPGVATASNETFAIVQITDDLSPSGYVTLNYDSDGDGIQDLGPGICGETPEPIAVEPATAYTAWPWIAGIDCPGASSTSGTIRVLLSSDPAVLVKAAAKG